MMFLLREQIVHDSMMAARVSEPGGDFSTERRSKNAAELLDGYVHRYEICSRCSCSVP